MAKALSTAPIRTIVKDGLHAPPDFSQLCVVDAWDHGLNARAVAARV